MPQPYLVYIDTDDKPKIIQCSLETAQKLLLEYDNVKVYKLLDSLDFRRVSELSQAEHEEDVRIIVLDRIEWDDA